MEALGVKEIIENIGEGALKKAALKKVAKIIAKQTLKKAIPYVGAAITAYAFVDCMMDD